MKDGGFSTRIFTARSGKEQRAPNRTVQIRSWIVALDWLPVASRMTFTTFFEQMQGSTGTFFWFDRQITSRTDFSVGTGNGSQTVFDLPYKSATATPTFKVAGTPTAGTWVSGGGTGGEDKVTFGVAPSNGAAITSTFVAARPRYQVRFATDTFQEVPQFRNSEDEWQIAYSLIEVI